MVKVQINHTPKHLPPLRTIHQRRALEEGAKMILLPLILGAIVVLLGAVNEYPCAVSMLALAERLELKRRQRDCSVRDLRLAGIHLRQFALVLIASGASFEADLVKKSTLIELMLRLRDQTH
jgi:hypothetical protein